MGRRVDPRTEDSLPMRSFLNEWFEPLLEFPDLDDATAAEARAAFLRTTRRHRGLHRPGARWGWKNPRNMWLIPFYVAVFPHLKFVHLVRDGRDMAVSENKFLLEMHGDRLLGPEWRWREDPVPAQLALWRIGNSRAAESAAEYLADNYRRVRYEDVCLKPVETIAELFRFLGAPANRVPALADSITPSTGIGRWEAEDRPELKDVDPQLRETLERFGYAAS
jgi:hypothetical protein